MTHRLFPILLFMLVAGCASQPATHYYTLSIPLDGAASAHTSNQKMPTLGVGPVSLPPILDHPGIVTQTSPSNVTVSTYHLWAGDLNDIISHLVADRLGELTGNPGIQPFPWDNRNRPQYSLSIDVDAFSGALSGPVSLRLRWVLYRVQDRKEVARDRLQLSYESQGSYASYVNTLNDLMLDSIHQMHQDITPLLK